ncbi:MAG: non-canonical purine NTP pyrophosphatase, partial [Pseudoalteromonas sp.]
TSAELTKEQKNAVSHRGQALQKLLLELQQKGGL